ncbi:DUF2577 domain-containing protein [Brevibacillus borstelensis]|uniref:DUF2577 domain-containing protein n=1 Tax=Brevibacillus borstelensis TaxID=45462 RepID=UPI002E1AB994|nr:DUF2577 domain-containing protein [Brevibacillus borstelensis]
MDSIDRLAQRIADMYKQNRNLPSTAPRVGTVISLDPIKIQYGNNIILDSRHLVIAEELMAGYSRTVELTTVQMIAQDVRYPAKIEFYRTTGNVAERITELDIPATDNPDSQDNKIKATMTYTDGLKVGDKVILQPDESLKLWYVQHRVWKEPET